MHLLFQLQCFRRLEIQRHWKIRIAFFNKPNILLFLPIWNTEFFKHTCRWWRKETCSSQIGRLSLAYSISFNKCQHVRSWALELVIAGELRVNTCPKCLESKVLEFAKLQLPNYLISFSWQFHMIWNFILSMWQMSNKKFWMIQVLA